MPTASAPLSGTAHALLCEGCGYAIAGLAGPTPCPECGRPVRESWLAARPGSIYQRSGRGPGRWLRATFEVVARPRAAFERVRIEPSSSVGFMFTNLMITATLATAAVGIAAHQFWLEAVLPVWTGVLAGLLLLTCIETVGLRFFARAESRRWRVTPAVAWTVCHHASAGWLTGGVVLLGLWLVDPAAEIAGAGWFQRWQGRTGPSPLGPLAPSLAADALRAAQWTMPLVLGIVHFETLVYIGTRRCRFANPPGAPAKQGRTDAATPPA